MAAPVIVPFVTRAANPGSAQASDNPVTAATGPAATIYFPPTMAQFVNIMLRVLGACIIDVEGSCDPTALLAADTANGTWKPIKASLTGVTGGAIVLDTIPPGLTAVRLNVKTLLAGNQAFVQFATANNLF